MLDPLISKLFVVHCELVEIIDSNTVREEKNIEIKSVVNTDSS